MKKYTIKQLNKDYPNDKACLEALFSHRFGAKFACPDCGQKGSFHRLETRKRYDCQCGYSVYPLAGTIFHKSDTSLKDWFHAIFLFASSRNGVSAKEIERQIGVTYKCAWRMAKQIRLLFSQNKLPFSGVVEADETYIGAPKSGRRGRGAKGKSVVFGLASRKGQVKANVVANVKTITLQPIINASVKKNSMVITDELLSYNKVARSGYNHQTVKHAIREYVRGKIHTNSIEGFWSQLKRSIDGTHHAVSPKYLQTYVDEYVYRWNERRNETPLFQTILGQVVRQAV